MSDCVQVYFEHRPFLAMTSCLRPYHAEYNGSSLITDVKQCWACSVYTWMGDRLGSAGVVGFSVSSSLTLPCGNYVGCFPHHKYRNCLLFHILISTTLGSRCCLLFFLPSSAHDPDYVQVCCVLRPFFSP